MNKYDIIIIGAGAAGLTAGIYAGRQGTKTLILEKGLVGGVGREVPGMENYPGFEMISGLELIEKMKNQCTKLSEIKENEVVESIEKTDEDYRFTIKTDKNTYFAKAIILATGSEHRHLDVPGEKEFAGRGVSYCATCDGLFFKDRNVLMIGGGNTALQESIYLSNIGCNVTIVHRRDKLRADSYLQNKIKEKGINVIYNSTVKEIKGDMFVDSVILVNKDTSKETEIETNGVFVAIGYEPHIKLAKELDVILDETNHIITDKEQKTNKKYVYSAGDVTGGLKQWVVSCSEGAIAASSAFKDIQ